MRLAVNGRNPSLPDATEKLLQRMVSPLCGLDRALVFTQRSRHGPRFIIVGAEMTGLHVLLNLENEGSYHVGGGGIFPNEALMRALGETAERYSQFTSTADRRHPVTTASYTDMARTGKKILDADRLCYFSDAQYGSAGFPFQPFDPDRPMGWVKTTSLLDGSEVWVPAQLVLLGYQIQRGIGEPWLITAVTTGTAAHTRRDQALRNALLELIQLDALMGHWYSSATAPQIVLDRRTKPLERILERYLDGRWSSLSFHWIASPDLEGMTVACVIKGRPGQIPAAGVGVGSDLRLLPAMYKALIEAVGVIALAKLNLVQYRADGGAQPVMAAPDSAEPDLILDLDLNVNLYAQPEHASYLDAKFVTTSNLRASDMPPDSSEDTEDEIGRLVEAFRRTNKEVVWLDLSADDIGQLGFVSTRVWSPDTLSLSLPSTPPTRHARFEKYGGVSHRNPHPYP